MTRRDFDSEAGKFGAAIDEFETALVYHLREQRLYGRDERSEEERFVENGVAAIADIWRALARLGTEDPIQDLVSNASRKIDNLKWMSFH